ncbi:MAG: DUF6531 domain-containing protein [Pseudomonas sp.]
MNNSPLIASCHAGFTRPTRLCLSTQKSWRFLALLLPFFFHASSANADAIIYWKTIGSYFGDGFHYSSVPSACADLAAKFVAYDVHAASMDAGSLNWKTQPSPTEMLCAATFRYSLGNVYPYTDYGFARLYKYVINCATGQQYNYQTKQCFTPGPGLDPAPCGATGSYECGPPPPQACAGNPINISNGNKFQVETDYPSSGASTLHFARAYNSLDGLWRHNYSTYLRLAGTNMALVMHHGRESFFTLSGSTVTAAPTELGQLAKVSDGWLYTAENNERFTFDASGRFTRWSNATGAAQQLTYANGQVTVTDNLGHSLSFSEDAHHQPLSLTVDGLQIAYGYNANQRLSQLTRTRDGQTERRQFHYEDPRNNALLTGLTDERGVRFTTWTFDDKGRATSSEHSGGAEHTQVAYNADGSSTVTNELGKSMVYRFVSIGGVKRVSAVEGEASANCPNSNSTFTYDARGLLKSKTDNKGHVTTYDYNERGLEISRTEAAGTPQARTISTEWHPTLFLPVTVTEPTRITTYSYDDQGRQLGQTIESR